MSATRLKDKPLLEINNLPIICHVVKKAKETSIGNVIVATEDKEIVTESVKSVGYSLQFVDKSFKKDKKLFWENSCCYFSWFCTCWNNFC